MKITLFNEGYIYGADGRALDNIGDNGIKMSYGQSVLKNNYEISEVKDRESLRNKRIITIKKKDGTIKSKAILKIKNTMNITLVDFNVSRYNTIEFNSPVTVLSSGDGVNWIEHNNETFFNPIEEKIDVTLESRRDPMIKLLQYLNKLGIKVTKIRTNENIRFLAFSTEDGVSSIKAIEKMLGNSLIRDNTLDKELTGNSIRVINNKGVEIKELSVKIVTHENRFITLEEI